MNMVDLFTELDGLPPMARLIYLVGHLAPEGRLTGIIPITALAQRTGITEAEIPQLLYAIPPEKALYLPRWGLAYVRERTRRECPGSRQLSGAVNRLVGLDPALVALWVKDNEDLLTRKGHEYIQARLIPLLPEDKGGSEDTPAWLTIAEHTLREALDARTAYEAREKAPEGSFERGKDKHRVYIPTGEPESEPLNQLPPALRERIEKAPKYGVDYQAWSGVPYPPEVKALARELWETTRLTARQIAILLGFPEHRSRMITDWAYFEAWPKRNQYGRNGLNGRDWPALRAQARELRAGGLTLNKIACELGVSYGAVVRWVQGVSRGIDYGENK